MNRLREKSQTLATLAADIDAAGWPPLLRYGAVVLVVGAVSLLRAQLPLESVPFTLYMPGMFLIGFFLGLGPGVTATLLSAFVVAYIFMSGDHLLSLGRNQVIGIASYILVSLSLIVVGDLLRRALARREAALREISAGNRALIESRDALAASEAFLRSVLKSSPDCIKVLDLDAHLIFMSERGKEAMEVDNFAQLEGLPWPDFWRGAENAAAIAAVAEAGAGRMARFQGFCPTMAGTPKWWDVVVTPIIGVGGKPEKILAVSRDITGTRLADEERMRLASLIEQSTDFIGMVDPEGRASFLNEVAYRMAGLPATGANGTSVADYFVPEDKEVVANIALPAALEAGKWEGELRFRDFRTGDVLPVSLSIFPIRDPAGTLLGYATVIKDIAARKRAEAQQSLLNRELGHRLKNTLAMIQAIANQTLRRASSLEEARQAFDARLVALGKAQDVLTGTRWESAEIEDIVRGALAPHGIEQERFQIDGPRLMLSARCALALSLALHELATNAAKYGALSNDGGKVTIAWQVKKENNTDQFQFKWQEAGGPPVEPPRRSGFGSFMIERSLSGYFRGSARVAYDPAGVSFYLEGPVTSDEAEFLSGDSEILAPTKNFNQN